MSNDNSKMSRQDRLRKAMAGMQKHFQPTTTFTLAGATYTVSQLTQLFQKDIDTADAADQAKAAWTKSVKQQRDQYAQTDPVHRVFKGAVVAQLGDTENAADALADFGYKPRKPRSKNVASKALAADKVRATRKARGTMGSKEKLAITGTVTPTSASSAPAVVPVISPGTPASATAAPASAPAAPGATTAAPAPQSHGTS
jgi:hypothetical protein